MFARIACLLLLLSVPCGPAGAEDPVAEGQMVISRQIEALIAEDADTAYALASPGLRSRYPDKDRFLEQIRKDYEAVHQAANYAFGRVKLIGGGEIILQEVLLGARSGRDWTAIYELRLMDDGSYRVNGVRMIRGVASTGI